MVSRPLEPGDPPRVGRFELLGRLGEGGQGIVYLGRGSGPGQERVAVKVLRSSVDAHVLERLARELDAVHQVQPFVTAGIIEASADGDRRYIVSEYIDGPSLAERVAARGPLNEGELQRLAVGTATALTAIHGAGVVHRDFKPANVLLGPDGPRVVDFGIARLVDAGTITSGVIGTPAFISPEQLSGARATSAADIFAWAVTMIFAATGRAAFGGDSVPAIMHRVLNEEPDLTGVPASLVPVFRDCLAKDPSRRPGARDVLLRLVDPSAPRPGPGTGAGATAGVGAGAGPEIPATRTRYEQEMTHPGRLQAGPAHLAGKPGTQPARLAGMPGTQPARTLRSDRAGRTRGIALAAGAGVVLAVAVVLAFLLTRHSPAGQHTAGTTSSTPPHASTQPATAGQTGQTSAAAQPAAGPVIPAAFAGTWAGTATMSPIGGGSTQQSAISFVFRTGATTIAESDESCVNTLTLTQATSTVLTFNEPGTAQCVAGTVTFTLSGASLDYHWTDNLIMQEVSTLHRR